MKVLFASWEVAPFFKVGGLGDVSQSLPKALSKLQIDIRLIVPFYTSFDLHKQKPEKVNEFSIEFNQKEIIIQIYKIYFQDKPIPIYLISNHTYLDIPTNKTWPIFNLAIDHIIQNNLLSWTPDVIHCNDSHTAFIPFFVKYHKLPCKTLFTIHNTQYQGRIPLNVVKQMGIDHMTYPIQHWKEKNKEINPFFEAITYADLVNTVSPSYSKEILTKEYGCGLNKFLQGQSDKLSGILNGIDYDINNPETDTFIQVNYNNNSYIQGKKINKQYLQK